jgi:hypothetical protein
MRTRSEDESAILRKEAERRVRAGESRADISRALNVPLATLANWAFAGGWRAKDIAAEQAEVYRRTLHSLEAMNGALPARAPGAVMETKSEQPLGASPKAEPPPLFADPLEVPAWAERGVRVRTPAWAPGDAFRSPEEAALYLADDLMRQGLLMEAERALRFARAWLDVSERVFRKRDRDEELILQEQKEMEAAQAREAGRLALQEARRKARDNNNNNDNNAAPAAGQDSFG